MDDLAIITKDTQAFLGQLQSAPYNFKLKGSGPLNFYLECEFTRDSTGTLLLLDKIGEFSYLILCTDLVFLDTNY